MNTTDLSKNQVQLLSKLDKTCLGYGAATALALAIYFGAMRVAGLAHILELRVLNILFLTAGVFFSLKAYSPTGESGSLNYFDAVKASLYTIAVAVVLFAVFIGLFISFDSELLVAMNERAPFGVTIDGLTAAGAILFEGLASGVIVALIAVHYFKKR